MALKRNLFWNHIIGDPQTVPCAHLTQQHPGGDATTVPCTHLTPQHPGGHPTTVPCVHINLATRKVAHPGGDPGPIVACTHMIQQHPAGDPGPTAPCTHMVAQHPGGDTAYSVCAHPMVPTRQEGAGNLIFYSNNSELENEVINTVQRLRELGVRIAAPRPLNIFNHDWVPGIEKETSANPAWPHYARDTHSLQIPKSWTGMKMREAVHHEMGHALLGHACVWNKSKGGSHDLKKISDPGLAMSEGWAHFVALAIENQQSSEVGPINYQGTVWENMNITANPNIEYCVGCCLWDLYDSPKRRILRGGSSRGGGRVVTIASDDEAGADKVALSFTELFKVYSPTLQTLIDGPQIPDIGDYIKRLKQNNPDIADDIEKVKVANVG